MNTEKREEKIAYFESMAAKKREESDSYYQQSKDIGSFIPLGQPILIGHHSEKRHRRDLDRIDNLMRKSVEAQKKAEYYEGRAKSLRSSNVIAGDDDDKVSKMEEKITSLEKRQEIMKTVNGIVKKFETGKATREASIEAIMALEVKRETAEKLLNEDFAGRMGFPKYMLTNNGANIRAAKKRLAEFEAVEQYAAKKNDNDPAEDIHGLSVKVDTEDNRIRLYFEGKPEDEVRNRLKKFDGFKWSPYNKAWQRQITGNADYALRSFLTWYRQYLTNQGE